MKINQVIIIHSVKTQEVEIEVGQYRTLTLPDSLTYFHYSLLFGGIIPQFFPYSFSSEGPIQLVTVE